MMAADALVAYVARPSTAMVLIMLDKQVLVFRNGRTSTAWAISLLKNDRKYNLMFLQNNFECKELTIEHRQVIVLCECENHWTISCRPHGTTGNLCKYFIYQKQFSMSCVITMQCSYNMANFLQNTHKIHPIGQPQPLLGKVWGIVSSMSALCSLHYSIFVEYLTTL